MRHCTGGLLLLLTLGLTAPVHAQGNKDLLDLLPAQTLACLELRHPERLSREVAALVKGSAVEDLPRVMARFRASLQGQGRFWMREEVGILGLFFSPEVIAEAGRVGGGAVALTGFSKDGTPEVVGLIQTGDSNLVGLYARAFTLFAEAHIVAEVEGVALYREKWQVFRKKGDAGPEEVERGPVIAQLPGLVILASSTDAVKDVIRRAKGKVADPSLSNMAAYRNAGALRDRPSLFGYANLDALSVQLDEVFKKQGGYGLADWLRFKAAVNPAALRGMTASLALERGTLELRSQLQLDPRQKSPVLELLADQGVKVDWLQAAPRDSALALTVNLGDGQKFLDRLLVLIDGVARAGGAEADELPSKKLAEFEEKLNLKLGKDVLGKISGYSLILTPSGEKGLGPLQPALVMQAVDADSARFLEEKVLPRLANPEGGAAPKLQRVEVQGMSLIELPTRNPFGGQATVLGRRGSLVVLGFDKEGVATALITSGKKNGLLSQEKVAAALKEVQEPVVLGVGSLGTLVLKAVQAFGMVTERRFEIPPPVPNKEKPAKPVEDVPPAMPDKIVEAYSKAMTDLPPLLLTVQRKPEQMTLIVRQPGLRTAAPRILDLWIEMTLGRLREQMQPRAFPGKKVGQVGPGPVVPEKALPAEKARDAEAALREAEAALRALKEEQQKIEAIRNQELRRKLEEERRKLEELRRQQERKP